MTEVAPAELAIYHAAPTVHLNGREDARLTQLLVAMEMREQEGGLSSLELRVSNVASEPGGDAELAFDAGSGPELGAEIAIYAGDVSAPQEIFRGLVTGIEAIFADRDAPELVLLAEDSLQKARLARRTKTYEAQSVADLCRSIASGLGLTPVIAGLADARGTFVQLDESDLAFLRRTLARYDADVQVVGEELHISPRSEVRRGAVTLAMGGQLRAARALADLSHQVTEVTVAGWDAAQGSRAVGRSSGASAGPGAGQTGADALRQSVGERGHHIAHLAVASQGEAQAAADAAFDARARRFVSLEGQAEGNPNLRVGAHVSVEGLGRRFSNTYYVVRTCHRFDLEGGYQTEFEAECAFVGA